MLTTFRLRITLFFLLGLFSPCRRNMGERKRTRYPDRALAVGFVESVRLRGTPSYVLVFKSWIWTHELCGLTYHQTPRLPSVFTSTQISILRIILWVGMAPHFPCLPNPRYLDRGCINTMSLMRMRTTIHQYELENDFSQSPISNRNIYHQRTLQGKSPARGYRSFHHSLPTRLQHQDKSSFSPDAQCGSEFHSQMFPDFN